MAGIGISFSDVVVRRRVGAGQHESPWQRVAAAGARADRGYQGIAARRDAAGASVVGVAGMLLIFNSAAGSPDTAPLEEAVGVLRTAGDVEVVGTSTPDELTEVLRGLSDRLLVVAGGDGTLHAAVRALEDLGALAEATLALIPLGTGNDFARGADIPLEPVEAARLIVSGRARRVDLLIDADGGVVVNNVHAGAGAQASRRAHRWKERLGKVGLGRLGYPIGAALAAFRPPFVRLTVEVDDQVVVDDRAVFMVSVGNGSQVGGGTELTPDAEPDDGVLDVMVSQAVGPLSRFGFGLHLRRGEHPERDDVSYHRGRRATVRGEPFYISADGEVDGPFTAKTWTLRREAFRMILP